MNIMNIKNRKVLIAVVAIIIVLIVIFVFKVRASNGVEVVSARTGELVKIVKVSGKVVPKQDADLGFEVGGTVAQVYKSVGDSVVAGEPIASLDQANVEANLLKAKADLTVAEAELAKLQGATESQTKVMNATSDAVQAILDGYTNADDAIHNKVDQFFKDPRTANPRIIYFFESSDLETKINNERLNTEQALISWKALIANLNTANYTGDKLSASLKYLQSVSSFLDEAARAVSNYEVIDGLSQTTIDKYRSDVISARSNVNDSISSLISKSTALSDVLSDVPVQVARVASARANVASYQANLNNTVIRAPFAGVISKQDAKAGQAVSPNASLVSVISREYKVEAFVPEVSIAGLSVGNMASVTLDAYGSSVVFPVSVTHIDPAETVRDGVSNYKIELSFNEIDEKVRSGMTANVSVETLRKEGTLMIPLRAVLSKDGKKTVLLKSGKAVSEREIEAGLTDSSGNVEVISGLSEGDVVLLNPVTK